MVIYVTGLGRTTPNPAVGEIPNYAAPMLALASLKVTLNGAPVDPMLIKYAGLTPGSAGLYQINLFLPEGTGKRPRDPGHGRELCPPKPGSNCRCARRNPATFPAPRRVKPYRLEGLGVFWMSIRPLLATTFAVAGLLCAQEAAPQPAEFTVETGTKVPLSLINSVSTKHSAEGDRVYLETVFPVLVNGRIVVPVGSYVAGTVTQLKKPGRVKGRGELYVRFDSLTLPNGVTRDFHGRIGSMDGNAKDELDRAEGKVRSEGNKSGDARTVGEATAAGASIGTIAGGAAGHYGMGAGIGAAAGAAAGMIGVLSSRGPDAVLARGSTLEMVLDRPISFTENELNFGNYQAPRAAIAGAPDGNGRRSLHTPPPPPPLNPWSGLSGCNVGVHADVLLYTSPRRIPRTCGVSSSQTRGVTSKSGSRVNRPPSRN